jgi:transposase-like protein
MSILNATFFRDEESAYSKLESILWPHGPECPKCGVVNDAKKIAANPDKKVRYGLWRCNACKAQFTVTVGTVFESSHIPLHKWLQAAHLINSSKKGISAKQIERTLQITYKSAWFMMHRLRAAMDPFHATEPTPTLGGKGKVVEMDETFIGVKEGRSKPRAGHAHKRIVMALVEREGEVRSFHLDRLNTSTMKQVVEANVDRQSRYYTDGYHAYRNNAMKLEGGHDWVDHSKNEYVRGGVHTNTIEGVFSIFKRGMIGTYQHCGERHLHRYLAEFDFRYNNRESLGMNDVVRTAKALKGAKGKRLKYRGPDSRDGLHDGANA